ncbi:MAG TPA: hypothetical protein ACFYEK_11020 [Candidatus Wunengus sp. YC60]|uniref:hypothetical protein n=1 Tax=Candidatus Wunengus sp. YC60 TaxID=3367697 RepID=UPI004024F971
MTEQEGKRILALMKYHGISQRKTAKDFNVSHSSIHLFLQGKFTSANLEAKFRGFVEKLGGKNEK